jgi:hypothetical protein
VLDGTPTTRAVTLTSTRPKSSNAHTVSCRHSRSSSSRNNFRAAASAKLRSPLRNLLQARTGNVNVRKGAVDVRVFDCDVRFSNLRRYKITIRSKRAEMIGRPTHAKSVTDCLRGQRKNRLGTNYFKTGVCSGISNLAKVQNELNRVQFDSCMVRGEQFIPSGR